ncbi:MAG: protoglobin domain-containing protein [Thermodesulfobacteriota bacterium]|nr:MAG: protoglobin domain-containing protein [Thermodesulfobacteriota bacterium]
MTSIEKIKAHYSFTVGDVENLKKLKPLMEKYRDDFVVQFYNYVKNFEEADKFLKDDATIKRHQDALKLWFMNLFSGEYGPRYLEGLEKVGMTHVRINLPAHYVNAAFHFTKDYLREKVRDEVEESGECAYLLRSVTKVLEINLDVFTSSYIAEEKKFFLSQRVENYLIQAANRFVYGMNLILVLGLVVIGVMVIVLFVNDMAHVFDGDVEKGLLSTLGTLLMLWVVIELMDTEIRHLRGGKFAIKVFVSVALVAVIREILIASLHHGAEATSNQLTLIAAVAVLGAVYWLISKVER